MLILAAAHTSTGWSKSRVLVVPLENNTINEYQHKDTYIVRSHHCEPPFAHLALFHSLHVCVTDSKILNMGPAWEKKAAAGEGLGGGAWGRTGQH